MLEKKLEEKKFSNFRLPNNNNNNCNFLFF